MSDHFETLVEEELGDEVMSQVSRVVREAYAITADMLDRYPTLAHSNGVLAWGWNRYLNVNNALLMAAQAGDLGPLQPFEEPVSSSLKRAYLRTERISFQTAFVVQMRDPESGDHNFPKIGPTREADILWNAPLFPLIEKQEFEQLEGRMEFFLIHGGSDREFQSCHLAVIDSPTEKAYRWTSKNYALHVTTSELDSPVEVDEFTPEVIPDAEDEQQSGSDAS